MAEMAYRWECPLRTCPWIWMGPDEESRAAFLRGGQIRLHLESHDVAEWAQEVIDLRPVPIEVAPLQVGPLIRRRPTSGSLEYIAGRLEAAVETGAEETLRTVARQVVVSLRVLAMEADGG